MSKLFWKKNGPTDDETTHEPDRAVDEQHALPTALYWTAPDSSEAEVVADGHPLPVSIASDNPQVPVRSRLVKIGPVPIPGIAAASALAASDAMGIAFVLSVPRSGVIVKAFFHDLDDEGLGKELWILDASFTAAANNDPFSLADADLHKIVGVLIFNNYRDAVNAQISDSAQTPLWYSVPNGEFHCQLKTYGADNIAIGAMPLVSLLIESYDPEFVA